ncbi:hypothetical protein SAMN04487967_1241 [Natronorubrum sediminis]|uniref:Uncharacterized protein n=1 Tax=Natronorubrum sediminis TaxID=640943 RepID=A0A1H6FTX8_9EURY|nr:hypothetical protein [Natronorubrum sediminis]SEH13245.1 hypothetical protein SAMN04487967_1241 [Natronorubrum sediminis]
MLESSIYVELAIYSYFALVAAIGWYLHGRLWLASCSQSGTQQRSDGTEDDGSRLNG